MRHTTLEPPFMNNQSSDLERRLYLLLEAARANDLQARGALNELLRHDLRARTALARLLVDEHVLSENLRDASISNLLEPRADVLAMTARKPTSSWRQLSAAAAGLAVGVASASLLFGYANVTPEPKQIAIANPGFESPVAPLAEGIPSEFRTWSGDYSEIVGPQQGITPHEGGHMFRFLRSDSKDPSPSRANHGNMYQFIDVRPLRAAIADGTATVDWSAWFNCVKERSGKVTQFEASIWAFAGEPPVVRANWAGNLHQELAYSTWRVVSDNDPQTWQRIAGSLIVPPDTDFLVIELKAIPGDKSAQNDPFRFAGHYADDVQLTLRKQARYKP